ncbi:MAG TPA: ABC transporter ATP-binding protein [Candidatus Binatia bacterium]|nr:ABC transporter ATP-binding protein [Candidatus Binatia bacterium]
MSARLEVLNANKSFRGLRAVKNVSMSADSGTIVALIGPNGAGKTTLFNMIAGALAPDSGEIRVDGARIDGLRPDQVCAAGVVRTFQLVKPFAGLSVLDNVIVGSLKHSPGVSQARRDASAVLARLGLESKADLPASALTLPDRKRLEVARALATRPKVLLLDEVMAGLRPTEWDELIALFYEINQRERITILLIEHVMRAVMALAQEVTVLHHGEVLARGSPGQISNNPAVLECYLGGDTQV